MSKKSIALSRPSALPDVLAVLVLAFGGLAFFAGNYKILTLLAAAAAVFLLLRRDLTPLRTLPALLLMAYVVFSGLTRFWAVSGKFFLMEYSKIAVAAALFLAVILAKGFDRSFLRRVMGIMVGVSTIYALLSVEAASTGLLKTLLSALIPGMASINTGFEVGTRLTGILGNANVLSSILAFGIFFSICLLCREENPKARTLCAAAAAVNAFTFLLLFSMGGTACFAAAVLVYLLFAGKHRGSALVRMLECAIPSLLWVFVAFPCFNRPAPLTVVPLAALVGNVITVLLLEKAAAPKLVPILEKRSKLAAAVVLAVIAAAAVYIVAGMNLTGSYTFDGEALRRSAYPEPGTHTLTVQADAQVNVTVISQDMSQIMMHTNTVIYRGPANNAAIPVPENSKVCYFTFSAPDGATLESAQLSSGESIKLGYTILPGFIANRLQGLQANQNAIQRTVFFRDGMKMFAQSPLLGNGVGSFETGITSVQEFHYETKYIHNHYIQILLESGILGLISFVGALLGLAWLLVKRLKDREWEYAAEYPALWAALVMAAAHMMVEVSMSMINFIWMVFVVFALIIRCCAKQPEPAPAAKGKSAAARKALPINAAAAVLPAVFLISLCCNLAAGHIARSQARSYDGYLNNMATAAKLDPYEANDAKLTYVLSTVKQGDKDHLPQANEYAQQLLEEQSNSIALALMNYYLQTGQYEQALRAAQTAAVYSASDANTWNSAITAMRPIFLSGAFSPLLEQVGGTPVMEMALDYYDMLRSRNADSMEDIALELTSMDFFGKILALARTDLSIEAGTPILLEQLYDSRYACDANGDLIPDQITAHSGVTFLKDGQMEFIPDASLQLSVPEKELGTMAEFVVECEDPAALSLFNGQTRLEGVAEADRVVFTFPMLQGEGESLTLTFHSSVVQTVGTITAQVVE